MQGPQFLKTENPLDSPKNWRLWSFLSLCSFSVSARMNVMILNGKLHMSQLQKQVSNRIFHKEEKERERSYIWMVLGKCAKIYFPSQSESNIGATKTGLMRMIVMKIWYFHGHTGILTEPMRHQNLYISYGDIFMKQSKLCTMYWI